MGRSGRTHKETDGTRRCIATGQTGDRAGLIRFVLGPDDTVFPDLAEKLPGRGMWLSATPDAFAAATKKNAFSRAAKQAAKVPNDLAAQTETLLVKRLIELLSLARKGGYAICGFEKTKAALMSEGVAALIQAEDGSDPQKRKLRPPPGENRHISCLSGAELGLAFGREHVIHAALAAGGLTDKIKTDAAKLAALRGLTASPACKQSSRSRVAKGKDTNE